MFRVFTSSAVSIEVDLTGVRLRESLVTGASASVRRGTLEATAAFRKSRTTKRAKVRITAQYQNVNTHLEIQRDIMDGSTDDERHQSSTAGPRIESTISKCLSRCGLFNALFS